MNPGHVTPSKQAPTADVPTIIQKKIVGVNGDGPDDRYYLLFSALAGLYPVEFRRVSSSGHRGLDALVVLDDNPAKGVAAAVDGLPTFVALGRPWAPQVSVSEGVRFGRCKVLEDCLRNQLMLGSRSDHFYAVSVEPGDEIIASVGAQPVWLARHKGKATCQIAGVSLPVIREKGFLFQDFNGERFLQLLPLMNFLRQLVKGIDWQSASLPACLVVDDPSPYLPSYGHLNFRRLAEHATKHDFFISVAIIPLDTWWVNPGVAETFRSFSPRLSVVMHGNDHTRGEMLVEKGSATGYLVRAAQAMRRMERLEQRHGLELLRIMEPPHGLIAEGMFRHLLSLGYEAALGSTERLIQYNPAAEWHKGFGLNRSEFLGGGLPVIPRIMMSPRWRNDVLLAAFLRQPIVIAAHHWDLADGDKLLIEIAGMINDLKVATWTSPSGIARSNYMELRRADELSVKLYSRRIHLAIPSGINSLWLHRPWLQSGHVEELIIHHSDREIFCAAGPAILGPIPVQSPCELEVYCPSANPIDHRSVVSPSSALWPVLRKVFMETRDRSAPWRHRVAKYLRGPRAKLRGNKDKN